MLRSRSLALAMALAVASVAVPRVSFAQPAPAEVKSHMDAADKAAKAKDWEKAATEFKAAFDLAHAAAALEGLANALYQAKHQPEAFEAYDELLRSYGDGMTGPKKFAAETRRKELAAHTGIIQVTVAEPGAEIFVDDKSIGTSPLPPRHVEAGTHKVRVVKAGFTPFEQSVTAADGQTSPVTATLTRELSKGHLVVREKDGKSMRVVIDGLDVGPTPYEGDLPPGPHDVLVRSSLGASTPQRVEVERGKAVTVELAAVAATAHLEVTTGDHLAIVFFDGKPLAEGSFSGDVAPGEHVLVVAKEGWDRVEKKINLAPQGHEKVDIVLTKSRDAKPSNVVDAAPDGRGLYGGFAFAALGLPGGSGNEIETRCNDLGASSCSTPMPIGGGLFGYLGYSFNPIGFEVMLGGELDQVKPKANFAGYGGPNTSSNPSLTGPPRVEQFTFVRTGGVVAVRARVNLEGKYLRGSLAAGPGLSYKYAALSERRATSTDGKNLQDVYAPSGQGYASPAVTADASVQWRMTESVALTLGMLLWLESSSFTDVRAPGDLHRYMAADGQTPAAITTPPYQITSGSQVFLGPYLGMQCGP
jgi:PEGA domain